MKEKSKKRTKKKKQDWAKEKKKIKRKRLRAHDKAQYKLKHTITEKAQTDSTRATMLTKWDWWKRKQHDADHTQPYRTHDSMLI